jgi:hypothetical protein
MKFLYFLHFILFVLYVLFIASLAYIISANLQSLAAEQTYVTASVGWNNDNIHTQRHPAPLALIETEEGFQAPLEDGSTLYVTKVTNEFYEFKLENATWWIYNDLFIWGTNKVGKTPQADNQIQAFSIAMFYGI